MTTTRWKHTITSVFTIFALALMGMAFMPTADAARPSLLTLSTDNIDFKQPSSITIHKHETPDSGTANNGKELEDAPPNPVNNITFELTKLDLDVQDSANWQHLDSLTYTAATNTVTIDGTGGATTPTTVGFDGAPTEKRTNPQGIATFSDLTPAVYLVKELDTTRPDGQYVTKMSEPFFVVLPMAVTGTNEWNYNVHAYPKNSVTTITKTINDEEAFNTDDIVTWSVEAKMPSGLTLDTVKIVDNFDPRILASSLAVTGVAATGATPDLVKDRDYTVDRTASKVTVEFTGAGLTKIKGKNVIVTYTGSVVPITTSLQPPAGGEDDGVIPNTANVTINSWSEDTNEVITIWGDYQVYKYTVVEDTKKALKGAVFSVYRLADPNADNCDDLVAEPVATVTTGDDGRAKFRLKAGPYCMKETTPPPGFKENDEVIPIMVDGGSTYINPGETNYSEVVNTKVDYTNLPFTGANGRLLLAIIGSALLAVALGLMIVNYRRKRHQS
ncbi:MAG: SpaH/EbpB family LPXTG-anchored major pilin [Actinomycetaceae bacterium]|nr:SpaH/EbpB family LPXTG-anchored major pilin [Actinomycetaceae bacterium]